MVNLVKRTNIDIVEVLQSDFKMLENMTHGFHKMLRSREQAHKMSIQITYFIKKLLVIKVGKSFIVRRYIIC